MLKGRTNPGDVHRAWFGIERRVAPPQTTSWHNAVTAEPEGWCDCADISISVPLIWGGNIPYRVLLRNGAVYHQTTTGLIPVGGLLNLGGNLNGALHRIRGIRFDAVIVELGGNPALVAPPGIVRVEAWARSVYPIHELLDANGHVVISTVGDLTIPATIDSPGAVANSRVAVAAPIYLKSLNWYNPSAAPRFILMWDSIAVPAPGTAPDLAPIRCAGETCGNRLFPASKLDVGCSWAVSSAYATYTEPNPLTPIWLDVHYTLQ
jgi:hypothetical protein